MSSIKNRLTILSLLFYLLIAKNLFGAMCYSIETKVDADTPVSPFYFIDFSKKSEKKCKYFNVEINLSQKNPYIGCYKKYEKAYKTYKSLKDNFKDKKIVLHKIRADDNYIIFPHGTTITQKWTKERLDKAYKNFSIDNIDKMFPTKFYGDSIDLLDASRAIFIPTINNMVFYDHWKKNSFDTKIIMLYNGCYTLKDIYKKLHNEKLIQKVSNNEYIIKTPIYISPTASLVINNLTIKLQTIPKPIYIMYNGKLFIKNSKIISWNTLTNSYAKIPTISKEKLLFIDLSSPRAYILGLNGSKTYLLNNSIKGLGFHSTIGTFGISIVKYPNYGLADETNSFKQYFLSRLSMPSGIIVGNDIYECEIGFYTNNAKNCVLLGNYFHDNIIYNVDPHDYSKDLIIARNITTKSKHAHGIVISRQVVRTIIAENLTFNNHSAGIMLDRLSNNNSIYKNLSFNNGYMGITVQESDNVLVKKNTLFRNFIDGVLIRNALRVDIINNTIEKNGKNGIEVLTKNINDKIYRDFKRDPYHLATSSIIKKNSITNNYNYALMAKNFPAIKLYQNHINGFYRYGGDLNPFTQKIIAFKDNFKLYGIGRPFRAKSSDKIELNSKAYKLAYMIFRQTAWHNKDAGIALADLYLKKRETSLGIDELEIESSNLIPNALEILGYLYLKKGYVTKEYKYTKTALNYLFKSIILGSKSALQTLYLLKYTTPLNKKIAKSIQKEVFKELRRGILFKKRGLFAKYFSCSSKFIKKYLISKLNIFIYKMHSVNKKDIFSYSKIYFDKFDLFSPELKKRIQKKVAYENSLKTKYFANQKNRLKKAKRDKFCIQYLNKQQLEFKNIKNIFKKDAKKDFETIRPKIEDLLSKINQFRTRKIDIKTIENIYLHDTPLEK